MFFFNLFILSFMILLIISSTIIEESTSNIENNNNITKKLFKGKNFFFDYPSNWKIEQINDQKFYGVSLSPSYSKDGFTDNLIIVIEKLPVSMNLSGYSDVAKKILEKNLRKYKLIDSNLMNLSNQKAERILFTHELGGKTYQVLQVWTILDKNVYLISFGTVPSKYTSYISFLRELLESFIIKNDNDIDFKDYLNNATKFNHYRNFSLGYGVVHPNDWDIYSEKNHVSFLSQQDNISDPFLERLDIHFFNYNKNNKSKFVERSDTQVILDQLNYLENNYPKFNLISTNTKKIDHLEVFEIIYTYNSNIGDTKTKEILINKDGNIYILSFTSHISEFIKFENVSKIIFDSFHFLS